MKKGMNIAKYLDRAEHDFSGFNGGMEPFGGDMFHSANGDDDYYGGDESGFYGADGGQSAPPAPAGGSRMIAPAPTPYQIIVANTTGGTLTAVLFGKNQYLLTNNFGSATGITVTPAQTNISYLELLQQSADQPFETSLIRVQSTNSSQITQILTVTAKDANGQQATVPVITQSYFSAYQQQSGILDVPYTLRIDGNTQVAFPVLASTTVTITFFPAAKVNNTRDLVGKSGVQQYGSPAVNTGGVFPVASMYPRNR